MTRHRTTATLLATLCFLGAMTRTARAEEPSLEQRGFFQRAIYGSTAGQPSWPKLTTTIGLHTAGLAGLGIGTWQLLAAASERSDLRDQPVRCDRAIQSAECLDWHVRLGEADAQGQLGLTLVVGGVLAHLAAFGVAEYWPNVSPEIELDGSGASLRATWVF